MDDEKRRKAKKERKRERRERKKEGRKERHTLESKTASLALLLDFAASTPLGPILGIEAEADSKRSVAAAVPSDDDESRRRILFVIFDCLLRYGPVRFGSVRSIYLGRDRTLCSRFEWMMVIVGVVEFEFTLGFHARESLLLGRTSRQFVMVLNEGGIYTQAGMMRLEC